MNQYYRPTRAEINLDALQNNIQELRKNLNNSTKTLASVKANGYGHGVIEMSKAAIKYGVDYLGVAFLDEALQLRRAGINAPILVLGYVAPQYIKLAMEHDVSIAFFAEEQLVAAASLPQLKNKLKIHIKIDTGMGRLGIAAFENIVQFIERALATPQIEVEGIFTHYSKADEADKAYTEQQYNKFERIVTYVRAQNWNIPIIHAANSAASIDTPAWSGDMARLGIAIYGLYPSHEVNKQAVNLQPVLTLKTEVVHVKAMHEQSGISYGAHHIAKQQEWVGTIPIGYADGFSRMLSGKVEVLIAGERVKVIGNICMDQCMIDLEPVRHMFNCIDDILHQEVVIIGQQGEHMITMEEIADKLGTINYEVATMLASRIPREYKENGKITVVSNSIL